MGSNRMSITPERPIYSPFFSVMGATSAMVFSSMGAAYGTAKSGVGIAAMAIMKPELIMKSVVPVVMAGILAIYGVVVAVLIANTINKEGTTMAKDLTNMGAGLSVGLSASRRSSKVVLSAHTSQLSICHLSTSSIQL